MRTTRSAALALAFLVAALPLLAQDDPKAKKAELRECEWYPLALGTKWTYEGNGMTIRVRVAEHEVIQGLLCARLETEAGQGASSEHIAVKEDGVYRVAYNGVRIKPPLCILKLPAKKGESWKVKSKQLSFVTKGTFTSDEEDDVDVGAGTFKTVKVTADMNAAGQDMTAVTWFASGEGIVKEEFSVGGQQSFSMELKSFKKGDGKAPADDDADDDEKKQEKR